MSKCRQEIDSLLNQGKQTVRRTVLGEGKMFEELSLVFFFIFLICIKGGKFFKATFWMKNLHKPAKQVKTWHAGKNLTECLKRQPCMSGYETAQTKAHIKQRSGARSSERHSCCALDRDFSFHTSSFTLCCSHSTQSEHVNNTQNEIFQHGFPSENEGRGILVSIALCYSGKIWEKKELCLLVWH